MDLQLGGGDLPDQFCYKSEYHSTGNNVLHCLGLRYCGIQGAIPAPCTFPGERTGEWQEFPAPEPGSQRAAQPARCGVPGQVGAVEDTEQPRGRVLRGGAAASSVLPTPWTANMDAIITIMGGT